MSWQKTLLICVAILLVTAVVLLFIFNTEPTAKRGGATKETAMLVEVVEVQRGTHRPIIEAVGAVEPAREVVLSPRLSGEVIGRADAFTPGSFVVGAKSCYISTPQTTRTWWRSGAQKSAKRARNCSSKWASKISRVWTTN